MRRPVTPFTVTLTALIGLAAVLGLWLGQRAGPPDEGRAIARVAAAYVAQAGDGAAVTDCIALPGDHVSVWIVVTCRKPGDAVGLRRYALDHRGRVIPGTDPAIGRNGS